MMPIRDIERYADVLRKFARAEQLAEIGLGEGHEVTLDARGNVREAFCCSFEVYELSEEWTQIRPSSDPVGNCEVGQLFFTSANLTRQPISCSRRGYRGRQTISGNYLPGTRLDPLSFPLDKSSV